jgi:hypothetical protein
MVRAVPPSPGRGSLVPAGNRLTLCCAMIFHQKGMVEASKAFGETFPEFTKIGMGPTTKAERWNGKKRHEFPFLLLECVKKIYQSH